MKAETQEIPVPPTSTASDDMSKLIQQYDCGPIPFAGTDSAFYERHLVFDNVIELMAAGPRERFEAFARSVRDILSQRWVHTEKTYGARIPSASIISRWSFSSAARSPTTSRIFCSIRSRKQAAEQKNLDWLELAGAGTRRGSGQRRARPTGGLLPRLDGDDATSRPWATGCATNTASSSRPFRTAGNRSSRTTGSVDPTPGRSPGLMKRWR